MRWKFLFAALVALAALYVVPTGYAMAAQPCNESPGDVLASFLGPSELMAATAAAPVPGSECEDEELLWLCVGYEGGCIEECPVGFWVFGWCGCDQECFWEWCEEILTFSDPGATEPTYALLS